MMVNLDCLMVRRRDGDEECRRRSGGQSACGRDYHRMPADAPQHEQKAGEGGHAAGDNPESRTLALRLVAGEACVRQGDKGCLEFLILRVEPADFALKMADVADYRVELAIRSL